MQRCGVEEVTSALDSENVTLLLVLRDILGRPFHEHAMLLMPVGYPTEDARVPDLKRKGVGEVSEFFE